MIQSSPIKLVLYSGNFQNGECRDETYRWNAGPVMNRARPIVKRATNSRRAA